MNMFHFIDQRSERAGFFQLGTLSRGFAGGNDIILPTLLIECH